MPLPPEAGGRVEPPPLTMPDGAVGAPARDLGFDAGAPAAAGLPVPPAGPDQTGMSVAPRATRAAMPEPSPDAPLPTVTPAGMTQVTGEAPAAEWLDQVCPYLLSEDGTWRSTQPDPGHRCMAQDPPGELPPMFQERFCLSDRHVRCEWYKAAQEGAPTAPSPAESGITAMGTTTAIGSTGGRGASGSGGGSSDRGSSAGGDRRRPLIVVAAIVGGFIVLVLIALLFGSDGGGTDPGADASPTASAAADATPAPDATPAVLVTPAPTRGPVDPDTLVRYRVQEDERLERIAEKFGIERRRRIIRANPGMEDAVPVVEVGQIIIVPVPASMSRADIEAVDGFIEFIDEAADGAGEPAA